MIDTAGIHDTEDVVESIGVERAIKYAKDADLVLYVVDTSVPLEEADYTIMEMIQDKTVIIVCNKSDLEQVVTKEMIQEKSSLFGMNHVEIVSISAKENTGIEELEKTVEKMFFQNTIQMNDEVVITNIRHKTALEEALSSMKLVRQSVSDDMPEDFYSIDLLGAYSALGRIIGEEVDDDVVNEIFSKFCMGK